MLILLVLVLQIYHFRQCTQYQQFSFPHSNLLEINYQIHPILLPMSSTSSSYLVLLLLCLATCSCNSRPIDVINNDKELSKSSHFSSKINDEKSSLAMVFVASNVKPSNPNKSEAAKEESSLLENRMINNANQETTAKKLVEKIHKLKDDHQRPKVGAEAVQTESLATISWKLPHQKRGEQQPGFNLDYEPPKTHPPVHN